MYSRSMKGSLMALMATFLLSKAFRNTYQAKSECQTGGEISGKTYNAPDTAESVDSDIDDHVVGIKMMN